MERIIENERNIKQKIEKELNQQKDLCAENLQKNDFLTKKLQESQLELEGIQKEIRRTFASEDEKQIFFHRKIRDLENLLKEKETKNDDLNRELQKQKLINKKQKQVN